LEFIGLEDYEVSMSQSKWHEVKALERVQRMIEAKKVEIGNYPDWKVDVAEIFSPPRFTQHAGRLGLKPGFAIDLSTGWDLDRPEDVIKMDKLIEEQQPLLLTGSPDCAPFTVLRNINRSYLNTKENVEKRQKGENHLSLCIERYRRQTKKKRCFLHEHPAGADSWDEEEMQRLQQEPDVFTVADLTCAWGMSIHAKRKGSGLVYKNTKWATNSPEIAAVLDQHCRNRRGGPIHRHVALIGGLAKLAEAYPDELVVSVLEGLRRQMKADGSLSSIEMYASGPDPTEHLFPEESHQAVDEELEKYYDDISGEELPANLVRDARQEEIQWINKIGLYTKVPRSVAQQRGKTVLPVRWVDVNKGDRSRMKLRSRIVGKELKARTKESLLAHELFSATPPWELVKSLFSLLVTDLPQHVGGGHEMCIGVFDISRAHFMPKCHRELYVEIPAEDRGPGEEVYVGRLNRGMYGFRDASNAWMKDWQELLAEGGYQVGVANPASFFNEAEFSGGAVHGDDFYVLGPVAAIDKMKELLGSKYQMRESNCLGFTDGCVREATVLNRIVTLGFEDGRRFVQIEPDRRHVEAVGMKLDGSNGVTTPSVRQTDASADSLKSSPLLSAADASRYRSGDESQFPLAGESRHRGDGQEVGAGDVFTSPWTLGTFEEACEVPHLQAGQELGFSSAINARCTSDLCRLRLRRKSHRPKVYDWNGSDFWNPHDQGFEQFAECGGTQRLRVGVLHSGPWCFTRARVAGLLPRHRHQGRPGDPLRFNMCKELCEPWAWEAAPCDDALSLVATSGCS